MAFAAVITVALALSLATVEASVYCPDGSIPQQTLTNIGSLVCTNVGQQDVCNSGYTCQSNPSNTPSNFINVCCKAGSSGTVTVNGNNILGAEVDTWGYRGYRMYLAARR
jgi:hypothetical protein